MNRTAIEPSRHIVAEASAWFVDFRAGDLDADARDRFIRWLSRSPEHIQAYLEVAGAWAELPNRDPQGRIDIEALLARARSDANVVSLEAAEKDPAPLRRPGFARYRLAAAVGALAVAAALFAWLGKESSKTYETEVGEQRSIVLADGSSVELNARSRIRIRFDDEHRDIDLLAGQALFRVAKDPHRPFTVLSDSVAVRAVGTQFDVYRKRAGTVVTVVEGRVAVSSALPAVALSAGEQLLVTARAVVKPKRADAAAATAWVKRQLMFEETPLAEVAEEFNRYNTRALVIADPQLQNVAISGVYSSTDPASLIRFLREQSGVQVNESAREITITGRAAH